MAKLSVLPARRKLACKTHRLQDTKVLTDVEGSSAVLTGVSMLRSSRPLLNASEPHEAVTYTVNVVILNEWFISYCSNKLD